MNKPGFSRASQAGFTLIEVLVALAIFATIALMTSSAMTGLVANEDRIRNEQARLLAVNRAVAWISRDLEAIAGRPARMASGGFAPALLIDDRGGTFNWTRSGISNPAQLKRSEFQRVAWYRSADGVLHRLHWLVLDGYDSAKPVEADVLTDVESIELTALVDKLVTVSTWPPIASAQDPNDASAAGLLPFAVEAKITLKNFGTLRRLVVLGGR